LAGRIDFSLSLVSKETRGTRAWCWNHLSEPRLIGAGGSHPSGAWMGHPGLVLE
jgi:hypothetical protein